MIRLAPQAQDGSALVILRAGPAAPIIIGSPHPLFDGTLQSGTTLFDALSAQAYVLSQTHRCANGTLSGCDGTTSVCGERGPYPESDMAHTAVSLFQAAHEALAPLYDQHIFINVHGQRREGVSLSNGTRNDIDPEAPVARLAAALADQLPAERITTCNRYEGDNFEAHLCGTTNTQGRLLNDSPDVCTEAAQSATDRFIHMEQSRDVRARPQDVAAAIAQALVSD